MAILDPMTFGALGTGGDDTAALQATCAAAKPGDRILFPGGRFGTSQTLNPPCTIEGSDPIASNLFALPGSNVNTLISIVDKSGVAIRNLGLTGEGIDTQVSVGAAIDFGSVNAAVENQLIERCRFDNFKRDYWVLAHGGQSTNDLRVKDCHFATKTGDGPVYAAASPRGGSLVAFYGYSASLPMLNSIVEGCVIDGTGVAFGIVFYGSQKQYSACKNIIYNMGAATNSLQNSYAILTYELTTTQYPVDGVFNDNTIVNPASCGIYAAGVSGLVAVGNKIKGQSRTDNATLPRAGVSLNGVADALVASNSFEDCFCSVAVAGTSSTIAPGDTSIIGNRIISRVAGFPMGIQFNCVLVSPTRLSVMGNEMQLYSGSALAFAGSVGGNGNITIINNAVWAAFPTPAGIAGTRVVLSPNY